MSNLNVIVVPSARRRVLIADSWFGSVACALELFRKDIFAIMNVKTGSKGFPKDTLLELVGEINQGRQ